MNLERDTNTQSPKENKSKYALWVVIGSGILFMLSVFLMPFILLRVVDLEKATHLLIYKDGQWVENETLPGYPIHLQISPAGNIWVATRAKTGLSRFDGETWQHYDNADFNPNQSFIQRHLLANDTRGTFTLVDEMVWGVVEGAVIHFDGQVWRRYPEAMLTDSPQAIVANKQHVWVIDKAGNLSHFHNNQWQITNLKDTVTGIDWAWATLGLTSDGRLWLGERRLWVTADGQRWEEVKRDGNSLTWARIVGTIDTQLWVGLHTEAVHAFDNQQWLEYGALGKDVYVTKVISHNNTIHIATNRDIFSYQEEQWRPISSSGENSLLFIDFVFIKNKEVWTIIEEVERRRPRWLFSTMLLVLLVPSLIFTFASGYYAIQSQKKKEAEMEAIRKMVGAEDKAENTTRTVIITTVILLITLILYFIFSSQLPDPDFEDGGFYTWWGFMIIFFTILWAGILIVKRWRAYRNPDPDNPLPPLSQEILQFLWGILALILFFGLSLGEERLRELLESWIDSEWLLPLFFCLPMLSSFVFLPFSSLVTYWVDRAFRQGDYETALARLNRLRRYGLGQGELERKEAIILLLAGQYQKAETLFQKIMISNQIYRHHAWINWGYALLGQDRFEEAEKAFQTLIENDSNYKQAHSALALTYLKQGIKTDEALALTAEAIAKPSLTLTQIGEFISPTAQYWSVRAWALTQAGRHLEAEEALAKAIKKRKKNYKPFEAIIYRHAGQIMLLRGDKMRAIEYFEQAATLDPAGASGSIAIEALQKLGKRFVATQ